MSPPGLQAALKPSCHCSWGLVRAVTALNSCPCCKSLAVGARGFLGSSFGSILMLSIYPWRPRCLAEAQA